MRGNHISADDWRAAADLLGTLAPANSLAEFGEIAAGNIGPIFKADLVVWTVHDRDWRPTQFRLMPDLSHRLGALWEPFRNYFHEHPMSSPAFATQFLAQRTPFVLGDHVPARWHARSALFGEVYVHLFARHQLGLIGRSGAGVHWTLASNRLRTPFGPRERSLAAYLKPHFDRIAESLARRERAQTLAGALHGFLTQPETAWALVESSGRIGDLSAAAEAHLKSMTGDLTPTTRSPTAGIGHAGALRSLVARLTGKDAAIYGTARLTATVDAVALRLPDAKAALVIFRSALTKAPRLTRREAEILLWLGEGKSNAEIGTLLGVSPRTVEKHCGNLFAKIGVESRFAAALFAREVPPAR